jgi:homoserine O-acetyltransferase/O-succinyltransferase
MHIYRHTSPITFASGAVLPALDIAYHTYGKRKPDGSNVIWVSHALTANSEVFAWWEGLFGENDLFNPREYFIVCPNVLGSHYGTTGPLHTNPATGEPYYHDFPQFTPRDMVHVHRLLADHLGIDCIKLLIGGSLGGQQAMEWAIEQPWRFDNLALLATNAQHSPWGIAFNESQRMAIALDHTWGQRTETAGMDGMRTARSIALLSYRHYATYGISQKDDDNSKADDFKASSYQQYQGEKLYRRFNAYSYWYLSKAMDAHNVARGRDSLEAALGQITARTIVMGINRDVLFPPVEQQLLAQYIPDAQYVELDSIYGHDGFLTETTKIEAVLAEFLNKKPAKKAKINGHHQAVSKVS